MPASSTPPMPTTSGEYDISRIDRLRHSFPDGFTVESHPPKVLDQQDIEVSYLHALSTAELLPAQCRSLLLPAYAAPSAGGRAATLHALGDRSALYVIALNSARPIPAEPAPPDCDQVSVIGSAAVSGTAERVAAPQIAGVVTTGARLRIDGDEADPDYIFTAAPDDRTCIVVLGSAVEELKPQQLLANLLVQAMAAVRQV